MQKYVNRTQAGRNAPATHPAADPTIEALVEGFFTMAATIQELHAELAQQGLVSHRLPFEPRAVTDIAMAREYVTRRVSQLEDVQTAVRHGLLGRPHRPSAPPADGSTVRLPLTSTRAYSNESLRKFSDEVLTDAAKLRELLFFQVSLLRGKDLPASEAIVVEGDVRVFPDLPYLAKLMQATAVGNPVMDLKILRPQPFAVTVTGDGGLTLQQAVDSAIATDRKFIRIPGTVSVSEPVVIPGRAELLVIEGAGKYGNVRGKKTCFSLVGGSRVVFRNLRVVSENGAALATRGNADVRIEHCELSGDIGISATEGSRVLVRGSEISRCGEAAICGSDAALVEMETSKITGGVEGVVVSGNSFVTISDSTIRDTMKAAVRVEGHGTGKILFTKITGCGADGSALAVLGGGGLASSGAEISGGRGWGLAVAEEGKCELVDMRITGNSGSAKISGGSVAGVYRKFVNCKFDGAVEISGDAKVVARGCSKEFPGSEPKLELKENSW